MREHWYSSRGFLYTKKDSANAESFSVFISNFYT